MTRFQDESGFNIMFCSEPEFENLAAEIYFDGLIVATVINESETEGFEFLVPDENYIANLVCRRFPVDEFLKTVSTAIAELKERAS